MEKYFKLRLPARYRVDVRGADNAWQRGEIRNMNSKEALLCVSQKGSLPEGTHIGVLADWPFQRDGVNLQLQLTGFIIRSHFNRAAVKIHSMEIKPA